jgi:hypothetical protein
MYGPSIKYQRLSYLNVFCQHSFHPKQIPMPAIMLNKSEHHLHPHLRELRLLISPLNRLSIPQSILVIKLNFDIMISSPTIQPSAFDACGVWHNLQLSIQRGSTVGAEPMLVDLSRSTGGIVVFGFALGDVEAFAGDDYVGGVGSAGPFLAVGAVAESCDFWFALGRWGVRRRMWKARRDGLRCIRSGLRHTCNCLLPY